MGDGEGMPPIDNNDELEMEAQDFQEMYEQYVQLEKDKAASASAKVVSIKDGKEVASDDSELVPIEPKDIIFDRMIFDAEQSLRESAQQRWLIDGIIPCDGFGILYGPSGTYKSFLALDIAASISSGMQWHGFDVDCPGPVLYIAAEGAMGLKERAVAWKRYHKREYGELVILPLAIMMDDPMMVYHFVEAAIKAQDQIGKPFAMVVIDTMARSFSGDENSAQETGAFINACSAWRAKLNDCSIMVIAHAGKNVQQGIRGSSALKAACDFVYVISRPAQLQVLVKNEKQKDIDEAENMRFALEPVNLLMQDHKGRERKSLVPVLESKGTGADPEDEDYEDQETAFEAKDANDIYRLVNSAKINGKPITEDDVRKEFIALRMSEGLKDNSARKSFARLYRKALDLKLIYKKGALLLPSSNR